MEYVVPVVVAICVPPLYILYPATPTLSVEAVHERLICEDEADVAVRPVGVDGAVVSDDDAFVVALTDVDCAETFPTASNAETL